MEEKGRVLVTGGTGFIASYIIALLLRRGYPVRSTVRNITRAVHLRRMIEEGKDLELCEADLLKVEGWAEAVKGCQCVIHVASPVDFACPLNDIEKMVRPAVDGTMNVLRAAAAEGIKRVVLTSSLAAVVSPEDMVRCGKEGKPVDASMFTDSAYPIPYFRSKALAEKAAWDFVRGEEGKGMELVVLAPCVAAGPALSNNTHEGLDAAVKYVTGRFPLVPEVMMPLVHVVDVAEAHIRAMEIPEAAGKRFILVETVTDVYQVALRIRRIFNPLGYWVSGIRMPNLLVPIFGYIDVPLQRMKKLLCVKVEFDTEPARKILGFPKRCSMLGWEEMVADAIQRGHVWKTPAFERWYEEWIVSKDKALDEDGELKVQTED